MLDVASHLPKPDDLEAAAGQQLNCTACLALRREASWLIAKVQHTMKALFALALWIVLTGCATTKTPVDGKLPVLELRNAVERRTTRGITASIQLPAGIYRPAFKDGQGVYYRGDAVPIMSGKPLVDAYVFVPFDDPQKRQGLWFDGYVIIDWFDRPIPFETAAAN